ncbi:Sas10/Utp3 family protein [Morchella snyderi]|nr:Sas10/Utp3 family protein [Morchella snyderi]
MAKKRRSTTSKGPSGPRELNPEDAKMAAFNTWEDIPDEEDEFHISRDKVLLEGESVGRRKADEYGEVSDEEVLALDNYMDDSEGESEGSDNSEDEEDEEEEKEEEEEEEEEEKAPKSKSKASSKKQQQQQQEDTDDSDAAAPTDDEDEDAEGWGTSKKDYYGGDTIATEQDAALEAAEALRLQAKHAAALTEADYGFDEAEWAAPEAKKELVVGQSLVVTEELPTAIPEGMGAEERIKLLEARHPEFPLLAEEFVELRALHGALGLSAAAAEAVGETVSSSVAVVKFRALSAYLGVLSMYFAVLSSPETVQTQGARLREHGVMDGLVKCRKMWEAVKDLEVEAIRSEGGERKRKSTAAAVTGAGATEKKALKAGKKNKKEEPKRKRAKLSPAFSDSDPDSDSAPAAKTARSRSKKTKGSAPVSDLSDLTTLATSFRATATKKASKKTPETASTTAAAHDTTDFGDDSTLGALDAEQKAARRRNLRFYTSQIVSKSAKRDAAGQSAGGDTDLPHRERRKEKELRLAAEAARRRNDGADLSDGDPDEEDVRVARQMREQEKEEGSDNEYYDMLAGKARQKKAQKQAWHEAEKAGGEVRVVEEVAADGKRAVGYVIDKNKGLTPHRKKDVRNPRVKKRKKYEAAKKKLGSKKAVYKGGLQGSYGGEMTGIKKNLVKSVKFK